MLNSNSELLDGTANNFLAATTKKMYDPPNDGDGDSLTDSARRR